MAGRGYGSYAGKLTARAVATAKPGRYGDGAGLWLVVASSGAGKWVFRFTFGGRVTEMGLGSMRVVTLAEARAKACSARKALAAGLNPIEARRRAKVAAADKPAFGQIANALIAAKQDEWRNAKHRQQWRTTLETRAAPLWQRPVDEIDTEAVLGILKPLWKATPETASRLRGRIEAVLDAAKAQGHSFGENPARWRGHLDKLLPKRQKLSRGHFRALPYDDVPAFMTELRERQAIATMAWNSALLRLPGRTRRLAPAGLKLISTRRFGRFQLRGRKQPASIECRYLKGRW